MIAAASLWFGRWVRLEAGLHGGRLLRFSLVGGSGVLVNNAILLALVEPLRVPPVLAAAVATECAIASNFMLNDRWTFGDLAGANRAPWPRRFASYNLLTLGGLLLSVGVLAALHELAGLQYLLANLVGICAGTLWNYSSNHNWTWSRSRAV